MGHRVIACFYLNITYPHQLSWNIVGLKHLISICQDLGESYDKYERELEGILQKGLSPRQHSSGYSSIEQPNETHVDGESTSDSDEFFDDDVNVLLS